MTPHALRGFATLVVAASLALAGAVPASAASRAATVVPAATSSNECVASTRVTETPPALDLLQSTSAWSRTRGEGVTVAVVDSGVAPNPHLTGVVDAGVNLVGDGTDAAGRTDSYGHGTIIAGQIAAQLITGSGVQGLAPGARILPIRVYAGTSNQEVEAGYGPNTQRMADGIRAAADRGAQIINVSMSTSEANAALADAVSYATGRGSLVVASAGNRDSSLALQKDDNDGARYPAGFPGTIGVAATGTSGVVTDASIHGSHVSLAAPGQVIPSTSAVGGDCVIAPDTPATSYAAAYVSAAAALVASAHPKETPAQWAYRLEETAVRTNPDTRSNVDGWGVVQPYDAITLVPGSGLRGPASPFAPTATTTTAPPSDLAHIDIVVGPGEDTAAIVTATAIGIAALIVLAALGTLAIFVSRRREDGIPGRPGPTGRGLYGGDTDAAS